MRSIEITGKRFGRLVAVEKTDLRVGTNVVWKCICDCGNFTNVPTSRLTTAATTSCGCYSKERSSLFLTQLNTKHGMSRTAEYRVWVDMLQRCINPNNHSYPEYGGRGIDVYEPWISSFENFYSYIGQRPGDEYTLERIDNNSGYYPGNVRWATMIEQANNRRTNVVYSYNGETLTKSQLCRKYNINFTTLCYRLDVLKMTIEQAIEMPLKR